MGATPRTSISQSGSNGTFAFARTASKLACRQVRVSAVRPTAGSFTQNHMRSALLPMSAT